MRIALFTDTFFPQTNGVATSVAALARELGRRGHDALVVCPQPSRRLPQEWDADHVRILRLPSIPSIVYPDYRICIGGFRAGAAAVREFGPDVIHLHSCLTVGLFAKRLGRTLRIPVIGTNQVFLSKDNVDFVRSVTTFRFLQRLFGWVVRRYSRLFYRGCDLKTALTHTQINALVEDGWATPIHYLPDGITVTEFHIPSAQEREDLKARYGLRKRVVVHLGRLSFEKNVADVLRMFAHLVHNHGDVSLLLIGDGPARQSLETLTRELGIASDVVFTGSLRHPELLSSGILTVGDVFTTASMVEAQGVVLAEAMQVGLPVVCMAGGAAEEIVADAGFTVPAGDTHAMAQKVGRILDDPALALHLRSRALRRAADFSIASVTDAALELYAKAHMAQSSSPR